MRRGRRAVLAGWVSAGLAAGLLAGLPGAALAAWTGSGSGAAGSAALTMPTGATPTASASGLTVTVSWPAATFPGSVPVAGYVLARYNATTGTPATVGSGCAGVVTTLTCTEHSVPPGSWVYTDTPVQLTWTGSASSRSRPVTALG